MQPSNTIITLDIDPLFDQCWASVADGEPALNQHWFDLLLYIRVYL